MSVFVESIHRPPRVSVIMTAYRDLRFIDAAVKSILAQTFTDFELIVLDDGTNRRDVFARLAALDGRIRVMCSDKNIGAYAAANCAIAKARGEIIARLDADDVAKPTRLARLVAALDADGELGLVGSWAMLISEAGEMLETWQTPEHDLLVRWIILFQNPFCHSTVAFRRKCFDSVGGYNATMRHNRAIMSSGGKCSRFVARRNIPEVLTYYRINSLGLTAANLPDWRERTDPLRRQSWNRLGFVHKPQLVPHLVEFMSGKEISDPKMRVRTYQTVLMLLRRFLAASRHPHGEDDSAARALKSRVIGGVLVGSSISLTELFKLWISCWKIDRRLAVSSVQKFCSAHGPVRAESQGH